jgi:hypothetical protein
MNYTKQQKKDMIKHLMNNMQITKTSQIQKKMLTAYGIIMGKSTIRRYKAKIAEDIKIEQAAQNEGNKGNAINPKTVQVLEPKKAAKLERKYDIVIDKFPFWLHCPKCHHGMQLERNPIQSCGCLQCGIIYSRRDKCFMDMRTGQIIKKLSIFDPILDEM